MKSKNSSRLNPSRGLALAICRASLDGPEVPGDARVDARRAMSASCAQLPFVESAAKVGSPPKPPRSGRLGVEAR